MNPHSIYLQSYRSCVLKNNTKCQHKKKSYIGGVRHSLRKKTYIFRFINLRAKDAQNIKVELNLEDKVEYGSMAPWIS